LEVGSHGIELDVHLSRDRVPVVIHDPTLDRTTTGKGAVAQFDLAELQKLNAGNGETVPTLRDVLEVAAGRVHIDIEVKAGAAAEAVVTEVAMHPRLDWVMSSFDHDVLRHVHALHADVELWPLTVAASEEALAAAKELGSPVIAISDQGLDEEIARFIDGEGLLSWVWTVNDPERAKILATWPVVGVCTDNPALLLSRSVPAGLD
jgi:glycerophosphoryl diester phosphodiesterase